MDDGHRQSSAGDETMKQVGALDEIVSQAEQDKKSCAAEPEEVASWIVTLGRAIRAILSF